MSYSSTLIIEELTDDGFEGRILKLNGSGLPLMGAEWGSENNLVTTWYPGNGLEGSQQTLGRRELPSAWNGEWHRTLLSRSKCTFQDIDGVERLVVSPKALRDITDSIYSSGRRLRVTLLSTSSRAEYNDKIVREGRAKTWKYPHDRIMDIKWSVEFQWVSRGEKPKSKVYSREDSFAAQVATLKVSTEVALASLDSLMEISKRAGSTRRASTFLTLGQLEKLANTPTALADQLRTNLNQVGNQLGQVSSIITKATFAPLSIMNSTTALCRQTQTIAKRFIDTTSRQPYETQTKSQRVRDTMQAATQFAQVSDNTRAVARQAMEFYEKFYNPEKTLSLRETPSARMSRNDKKGTLIAVHIAREGDSPMSLSMRYYGSPDNSLDILKANRLPFHQTAFKVGSPIVIPVLSTAVSQV